MKNNIEKLKSFLKNAEKIAVLSGAGMSTASGLPDFRSQRGLYNTIVTPLVFSKWLFRIWPDYLYKKLWPFYEQLAQAKPNEGHLALAALEKQGKHVEIITQNVDCLHQAAGSTCVHEIHGTVKSMTCMRCGKQQRIAHDMFTGPVKKAPRCSCGGVFKPDIVFFGEELPGEPLRLALLAMLNADLVLVCGTSLKVAPANQLLAYRVEGTPVVVINRQPTMMDEFAALVIHDDIGGVLKQAILA